jgi:phytoene dehydrogenase-like protein
MARAGSTVDAVVVGGGPNGLVAANLLLDAGWEVLLVEAEAELGGAVRSAELAAPGFSGDVGSAFYPMAAASPIIRGLDLPHYGLRWQHAPATLAHVFPDDRTALISRDLDETAASLDTFAPGDGAAWRAEFAAWSRVRDNLLDALLSPLPPIRAGTRLLRDLGIGEALRFARMATLPARRLGEERFTGEGARLLLAGNALHAVLGPGDTLGAVYGWLLCMLAQDVGFPVPEGGAGALSAALARRFVEHGGEVTCGRRVREVLVSGGRAVGILDDSGAPTRTRRAVLAAVPATTLYQRMLSPAELPPRLLGDVRAFEWDAATVKVNWALDGPIPWSNPEAGKAGTVHLGGDMAGLAHFATDLGTGQVPARPFLILGQMTTADGSRSPAGTESVWTYTHVPRGCRWSPDELRGYADLIDGVVERNAPGFTGTVRGRSVQGPLDLEDADASLSEGAIIGGTAALHQQLVFRPVPGLGRADTPIDCLYLASASAHPGGSVHGGPGANAARAALARNGALGPAYGAAIRAAMRAIYA